jgi:hypothetical protein
MLLEVVGQAIPRLGPLQVVPELVMVVMGQAAHLSPATEDPVSSSSVTGFNKEAKK